MIKSRVVARDFFMIGFVNNFIKTIELKIRNPNIHFVFLKH